MKTKILIDLTDLSNLSCGFGQIASNYIKNHELFKLDNVEFIFLIPAHCEIELPDLSCKHIKVYKIYRIFSFLLPKVDIWHATNQLSRYLRLTKSTKFILTIHDVNFLYEKSARNAARKSKKLQKKIDRADIITSISNYAAEDIRKNFDLKGKKIDTIYNGVERIDQNPALKPNFIKTDRPFFFTIGQIRRKKNFHILLDVMKNFPEYDLYISGQDHFAYAQEIKESINRDEINNVFVTGKIKDEEKVWMYKYCSAFFFPSTLEGFGLPVIEAMQFGKTVFSSDSTSLPEICQNHAILWKSMDPQYMSNTIKQYLHDHREESHIIAKMKEYAYSFSYKRHIQQYINIYAKLSKSF